jgi:hypothetical protein
MTPEQKLAKAKYNKAYKKVYYEANREKLKADMKAYYEANREKLKADMKAWSKANPEKCKADRKARYDANPKKYRASMEAWRKANPEKCRADRKARYDANPKKYRANQLMRNFGITLDQYYNKLKEQNNCCAICSIDRVHFAKDFSVDHNHDTDVNRGLLCMPCNLWLGLAKDNRDNLARAINYLDKPVDLTFQRENI